MSRSNVQCKMGHTALFPGKNDVRSEWIHQVKPWRDIITISQGLLDTLNILRYRGRIFVCDLDPGVIESTHYIRVGNPKTGKESDYPKLKIMPELYCDIRTAVEGYLLKEGGSRLGAVDLDLTGTVEQVWPLTSDVLGYMLKHGCQGVLVPVTYRDGRDHNGRNASDKRVDWMKERLPSGVSYQWHKHYRSDWIGRFATREIGSSMTTVTLRVG